MRQRVLLEAWALPRTGRCSQPEHVCAVAAAHKDVATPARWKAVSLADGGFWKAIALLGMHPVVA